MWRAPTSVLWGVGYGLFVWWALNDVAVPVSGAVNVQPLWEGLVGTVVCYGARPLRADDDGVPRGRRASRLDRRSPG